MKKLLISIIIAIVVISGEIYTFATETESTTESTQQSTTDSTSKKQSIKLTLTKQVEVEQGTEEVKIKLGYGEIKGVTEGTLSSFIGILEYSEEIFESVTINKLNGYGSTYKDKKIIIDPSEAKANTDVVEFVLKLKEGVEPVTTDITFKTEEIVAGEEELTAEVLTSQVTIAAKAEDATKTETTKDDENKKTENTKDDDKKGELEILPNTTKTETSSTNTAKTENSTKDTTITEQNKLPKTGTDAITLVIISMVIIGIITFLRYKNIEIK